MIPYCKTALQSICPCDKFKQIDNNGIVETCQEGVNLKCQNMLDFEKMTPFEWLALAYSIVNFEKFIIKPEYDNRKVRGKCEEIKETMAKELKISSRLLHNKLFT